MEGKVGAVYKAFPQHNSLPIRLFQGLENVAFPSPPSRLPEARERALGQAF